MGLAIRKLLAENIGRIFEARGYGSADKAAAVIKVPKSTIDRAWRNRSAASLDTLDDLATGLKMQPWQLLVPGLDPDNLPVLAGEAPPAARGDAESHLRPIPSGRVALDADELARLIVAFDKLQPTERGQVFRLANRLAHARPSGSSSPTINDKR